VHDQLVKRFLGGDRLALSRLLSLAAHGEDIAEIVTALPRDKVSRVVAITGSAGVGKSTLVGKLIEVIRASGQAVAVLACDPQSPLTGGALLGDRFRMPSRPNDDGVFIRSLATPGGQGAVLGRTEWLVEILESFGFDVIIIETVGAGQGDTAVAGLADVVVLLLQPETGDDLQWEKAGVFEVADIIAIHKSDLPGAERALAQVRMALDLSMGNKPALLSVSSKTGAGIEELWRSILERPMRRKSGHADGSDLLRLAQEVLASRFDAAMQANDAECLELIGKWRDQQVQQHEATARLLSLLCCATRSGASSEQQ
jgi:LAO/AO transport system ATPase